MTSRERIANILKHQPVDRVGIMEQFWDDTQKSWASKGHIDLEESIEVHFDLDMINCWALNLKIDIDFVDEVVAETEDTITYKDGNGAILKKTQKTRLNPWTCWLYCQV